MINISEILNARILIVDDKPANVLLLEKMLSAAGYSCVTSTLDSRKVCELHRKNRYDLILLDLGMPGMDGFEVMEGLKVVESDGYLPVLVITAQPDHKLRALKTGAKDFVSKPFELVEVKTRIHNMLEVRLLYREAANQNLRLEQAVRERTAELQESEARFQRLTELASDWYWEQDAAGRFTKVSGAALEMLSLGSEGAIAPASGVEWNAKERAELEALIAARKPFLDFVYSRTDAGGSLQYFQVSGEPIFDSTGAYSGYRGVGLDVTARHSGDSTQTAPRTV